MPTISIHDKLQYFYLDSGAPDATDYDTVIILHGHTFHAKTFERLFEPSHSRGMRIVVINRRGYPGTTHFSPEEKEVIYSSSEELIQGFMETHGINLALAIDGVIRELNLPPGHNVTLCAWSLGNAFLLNAVAMIDNLQDEVKDRLKGRVKSIIMWQPPHFVFGIVGPPGNYFPLTEESIPPEDRGATFGVWVSGHWGHGDRSTHDFSQLSQRTPLTDPPPTATRISQEQFLAITELSLDTQVPDNKLLDTPVYFTVLRRQAEKALLDAAIQDAWGHPKVIHLVGDEDCWPVIYGHWYLEDLMKSEENVKAGLDIGFKMMKQGNHFVMIDHPEKALDAIQECIAGDMTPILIPRIERPKSN